jgi:hypothetical protein
MPLRSDLFANLGIACKACQQHGSLQQQPALDAQGITKGRSILS